jgi:hypothetical protein
MENQQTNGAGGSTKVHEAKQAWPLFARGAIS